MIPKFQQGGMITAPDPRPYRTPLQGLDPNVFKYNLQTKPLDTSGMVQILQFNENADIRRQQQAVLLEQAKIKKEIEKAKLDFQKEKFAFEMLKEVNKISKSVGGPVLDTKGNPFSSNIEETPFIKAHFHDIDTQLSAKQAELDKAMVDFNTSPTSRSNAIKIANEIAELRSRRASDTAYQLEVRKGEVLAGLASGDKKYVATGEEVNYFLLDQKFKAREDFLNGRVPNSPNLPNAPSASNFNVNFNGLSQPNTPMSGAGASSWEFGSIADLDPALKYNVKNEEKRFNSTLESFLTPVKQDESNIKQVGIGSYIETTETGMIVRSMPTVINDMTQFVGSSRSNAAWLSNILGVNFFDENGQIKEDVLKKSLKDFIEPQYNAAFSQAQGIDIKNQIGPSKQIKESTFKADYNTDRTETRDTKVEIDNVITKKGGFTAEDIKSVESLTDNEQDDLASILEILKDNDFDPQRGAGQIVVKEAIEAKKKGILYTEDKALERAIELRDKDLGKKLGEGFIKDYIEPSMESTKKGGTTTVPKNEQKKLKNQTPGDLLNRGKNVKPSGINW